MITRFMVGVCFAAVRMEEVTASAGWIMSRS